MSRLAIFLPMLPFLLGFPAGGTAHANEAAPVVRSMGDEPSAGPGVAALTDRVDGDPDFRSSARLPAYRAHAPLAYFSLGSLAVGGLFYGIQASLDREGRSRINGDGARMDMAVGAAGVTALAAGAAYFYYVLSGREPGGESVLPWAGSVRGGIGPEGSLAAALTVPIASLSP